jgi:hypothetical protein
MRHINEENSRQSVGNKLRKGSWVSERIAELHRQVDASAYERVVYKVGSDIFEASEPSYSGSVEKLEQARLSCPGTQQAAETCKL